MLSRTMKPAAAMVLFSITACTTLQPVADPATFLSKEHPRFVVVTTTDQTAEDYPLLVNRPRFEAGTISGLVQGEATAIPITHVQTLSANQINRRRTTIMALTGAVILGTITYLAVTSGSGYSDYYCEPPCRGAPEVGGSRVPR
jgi:hypothetical protein